MEQKNTEDKVVKIEKILEELHYKNEKFLKTKNKSIFIVKPKIENHEKLSKSLENLIAFSIKFKNTCLILL